MKKILVIICTFLTLFVLVACKESEDANNNNIDSNDNSNNSSNNNESNSNNNENDNNDSNGSNTVNKIDSNSIIQVYDNYSEGLVFVKVKGDNQKLYCINKSGEIVFSIVASYATSFSNGLSYTSAGICDKTGKITTAEDLGGQEILKYDFAADFILVSRSTTSYLGTVSELATFNTKFEKIVEFSADFYESYIDFKHRPLIDGYIPHYDYEDKYLNLYTGQWEEGKASLYSKVKVERQSDLWEREGYWGSIGGFYIYNKLDSLLGKERQPILDLSQNEKYANIDKIGYFRNGIAPVIFEVENGNSELVYYYTIMNEEGDYLFEPVQIGGLVLDFSFENGYFVCNTAVGGNFFTTKNRSLEVYDTTGRQIAKKEYSVSAIGKDSSAVIFDEVIVLKNESTYYLYNTELTPLF